MFFWWELGLRCFWEKSLTSLKYPCIYLHRKSCMWPFCLGALINKDPPARKEQLAGCRKCCMKTSSNCHLLQSQPQLQAPPHGGHALPKNGHMSLTGLDGCRPDPFQPSVGSLMGDACSGAPCHVMKTSLGLHCC